MIFQDDFTLVSVPFRITTEKSAFKQKVQRVLNTLSAIPADFMILILMKSEI
jgi:hypothetical protein